MNRFAFCTRRHLVATLLLLTLTACNDSTRAPLPGGDGAPIASTVDLRDAVALAVGTSTTTNSLATNQSSTHVIAVTEEGEVEPVEDEEVTFRDFQIIDGRVFLTPNNVRRYGCALVEVIDDTQIDCVDPHLSSIYELKIGPDGTLYYQGSGETDTGESATVIRKRTPDGSISHVFRTDGPLTVYDWAVASDGLIYLFGETFIDTGSGGYWIRRLDTDGSLTTILGDENTYVYFLGVWPDGNLYLYSDEWARASIRRIRPSDDVIDPAPYLAYAGSTEDPNHVEPLHDAGTLDMPIGRVEGSGVRHYGGRVLKQTSDDRGVLVMELYPTPRRIDSGLDAVRSAAPHEGSYYFAAKTGTDAYGIVRLNIDTGAISTLYETTTLEMFSMTLNQDASAAMFDAFDAAHNQYVLATVDLTTGDAISEAVPSTFTKLEPLR